jgi:orotidine-5'-phosphate decarboxylase
MATPIIALDVATGADALNLVERLGESVQFYKIGSPLFTAAGPQIVREVRARNKRVFLDLKFHDIPSTVARSVEAAATLEVDLLTVHAAGGVTMLRAALEAAGSGGPRILGVTVLTSFSTDDIEHTFGRQVHSVREEVLRMTGLVIEAGLHGVVASALEIEPLRRRHGADLLIVTPGIRPDGEAAADQVRTATPGYAARAGANFIVIGRPVTAAPDPLDVMRRVHEELATGAPV